MELFLTKLKMDLMPHFCERSTYPNIPGLIGTLPPEINKASALHVIDMTMSRLSVTLHSELADLQVLDCLTLWSNSFSGTIEAKYGRFQRVREFNVT